jgi:hypothetical protein
MLLLLVFKALPLSGVFYGSPGPIITQVPITLLVPAVDIAVPVSGDPVTGLPVQNALAIAIKVIGSQ